jgi:tetratricopeptide (TPR) repeat protein
MTKAPLSGLFAFLGPAIAAIPFFTKTLYQNYYFAIALILLFVSWLYANWQQRDRLREENRWERQKRVMVGMSLCMVLGLGLLAFYEQGRPKYTVALISEELYRVPPQLNTQQLKKLGAECNTYGNTLCSHDVFAKIVKNNPRDYVALANLAMAQSHLGFHSYAVTNFKKVIDQGLKRYDIYKFYGNSLLKLYKKEKALAAYRASLRLKPNQPSLSRKIERVESE